MSEQMPCPIHPHRLAAPGLVVCLTCRNRLAVDLAYIAANWHHLVASTAIGTRGHGCGHTVPGSRPPLPIDLVDHARDWHNVLLAWCRLVCEDRAIALMPVLPESQAEWLIVHADWLCAQDFGDEACSEMSDLAGRLGAVIGDSDRAWTVPCPAPAPEHARTAHTATQAPYPGNESNPAECGPQIDAQAIEPQCGWILRVQRPPLPVEGKPTEKLSVHCRQCGTLWDAHRLLLVARAAGQQVWVDAETAAQQLGTTPRGLAILVRSGRIARKRDRYQIGARDTHANA